VRKDLDERVRPALRPDGRSRAGILDPVPIDADIAGDHRNSATHVLQGLIGAFSTTVLVVREWHDSHVELPDMLVLRFFRPRDESEIGEALKAWRRAAQDHQFKRNSRPR